MSTTALAPESCPTTNGHAADQFVRVETPPAVPLAESLALWEREARRGCSSTAWPT
jgi:hypothetical protein